MAQVRGARTISDAKVLEATGRNLKAWDKVLNSFDVRTHGHTAAAKHLREAHGVSPWWAQTLTVRYEYEHGLRREHTPPPPALQAALKRDAKARKAFEALTDYQRSQSAAWIGDAKREETRARRLEQTLAALRAGQRPPGV